MTFYVVDKRTGKEPIFDGNHIFKEKWCKNRLYEYDIDGWYISEGGQLALVDDCCNMAYPPQDRFKIVYDIEKYAKENNLFVCTTDILKQIRLEVEQELRGYSPISERHKIISKVLTIIDRYTKEEK